MSTNLPFDEDRQQKFLDSLRETCNITVAAQAIGVSTTTVAKHRKEDPLFEERFKEAMEEGIDLLEHEAHRRAFRGVEEPVVYQGQFSYEVECDPETGQAIFIEETKEDPTTKLPVTTRRPKYVMDPRTGQPKVKVIRKYSDNLTTFLLKSHRPEKYRDNAALELTGKNGGPVEITEQERASRLSRLFAMARLRKQGEDSGIV